MLSTFALTSDETRRWFVKHLGLTSRLYYTWSHLTLVVACGLRQVAGAAHQLWLCGNLLYAWAIAVAGSRSHSLSCHTKPSHYSGLGIHNN